MTPLIDYWLKANLFLLLFYGCYALLLRRHTFLVLNRTYLLGSLVLALLLPLVHIPGLTFPWPWETTDVPAYATVSTDAITVTGLTNEAEAPLLPDWPVLALWAFALVVAGLLFRTGWRTVSLLRLIRQWPAQYFADHTLVLPPTAQTPTFSFFRYLVLNPNDAHTEAVRRHELVHIRQKHSVDVLLLEVIQALCWPNPALFGYRQAIRQVHEYLADRDATPQTPTHRDAYARFLVNYAFHLHTGLPDYDNLAHSFGPDRPDSPTLKQRIQMLYQQHTNRRALWKYTLVLPLATALLAMTNVPESAPEPALEATLESVSEQTLVIATPAVKLSTNSAPESETTPELITETLANVADSTDFIQVQGLVSDQSGKPLPGASVVIRDGRKGTTTDTDGRFKLDVPTNTRLVASFVGFEAQEMTVTAKAKEYTIMTFRLKPQVVDLSNPVAQTPQSLTVPAAVRSGRSYSTVDGEVFTVAERNPEFPGGIRNLFDFVTKNVRYPEEARQRGIQGKVFVNFVVNPDGAIDRIRISKGLGYGCDEEAVRLMSSMPKWTPGMQGGRPVAVKYNLPIEFRLSDKVELNQNPDSGERTGYSVLDSVLKNSPHIYHNGQVRIINPGSFQIGDKQNSPLYILDGKEITQEEMATLNPNTIQSIEVLKNASATSIYGEKGRNGVARITTKKAGTPEKKKDR